MNCRRYRAAFTVVELLVASAVFAILMTMVVQLGYFSLSERTRCVSRQLAGELAGNVLEAARACPHDELTPDWAAGQQLPDELKRALPDGQLFVRVEPEADRPRTKRVTVEVRWQLEPHRPPESVRLAGLFSARSAPRTGGKP